MSTTLRLDHLYRQGVPDVGSCPITISREHYDELPAFPIDDLRDGILSVQCFKRFIEIIFMTKILSIQP